MVKRITLLMALLLLFIAIGCQALGKQDNGTFYGTVEMEQIDISAETAGVVKEIMVSEGEQINKNTILAVLNTPEGTIRTEQAELGVQAASNERQSVYEGAREEEIAAQKATVKQMEAQTRGASSTVKQVQEAINQGTAALKQAEINTSTAKETFTFKKKNYDDALTLFSSGSISKQDLDTAEYNMNIAKNAYENSIKAIEGAKAQLSSSKMQLEVQKAQAESLKQQLEAAEQKLSMVINGALETSKNAAELGVKQAETNYELSKLALEKRDIKSEIEGVIHTINYSVGEYVLQGSHIATVTNPKNLWVKIYVPEKLLPQLKLQQEVEMKSDFVEGEIKGVITNISPEAEYTPMNIVTKDDRERLVYAIKVKIIDNAEKLKAGMLLDVKLK
ncbi:MAG: transporter [Clostridia bacterium]|jgi:HlyD family secretion protein|nr:transporter [Clostridia bacterium]